MIIMHINHYCGNGKVRRINEGRRRSGMGKVSNGMKLLHHGNP